MRLIDRELLSITIDEAVIREIIEDCIDTSIRRYERFNDTVPGWDRDELADGYVREIIQESERSGHGAMLRICTTSENIKKVMRNCIDSAIRANNEMKAIGRGWSRVGMALTCVQEIRMMR